MLVWAQSLPQPVGIRCGINAGQLEFVHDPYDTLHVCGAPINEAQRIMDAAQDGQMFVHAEYFAARLYFVAETHHPDLHYRRHPETYEILAKHGKLLHVQSITGSFPPPPAATRHLLRQENRRVSGSYKSSRRGLSMMPTA